MQNHVNARFINEILSIEMNLFAVFRVTLNYFVKIYMNANKITMILTKWKIYFIKFLTNKGNIYFETCRSISPNTFFCDSNNDITINGLMKIVNKNILLIKIQYRNSMLTKLLKKKKCYIAKRNIINTIVEK
jgi:hypothetical protein